MAIFRPVIADNDTPADMTEDAAQMYARSLARAHRQAMSVLQRGGDYLILAASSFTAGEARYAADGWHLIGTQQA
jgi:hypothetical protein